MFKGYIFLQFYCVFVFSMVVKINFRSNTATEGKLASKVKWAMQVASEKGASSWLAPLPIANMDLPSTKVHSKMPLCLQYGWQPSHLPSHCICGQHFTVEHALICTHGGFPLIRHNELRDMTAGFLTEVCHIFGIEPPLQPLTGEHLTLGSANRKDGACLDISADNFLGRDQNQAFFIDIRVFSPFMQNHQNTFLSQCYKKNEQETKRVYDQHIREVERGVFQQRISSMIAQKHDKTYSKTLDCIRCKLSYSFLRSAIMCLRGARSSIHHPTTSPDK